MGEILDQMPEALDWVHGDLLHRSGRPDTGRDAMTAEQVLRAVVVKQRFSASYAGTRCADPVLDGNAMRLQAGGPAIC